MRLGLFSAIGLLAAILQLTLAGPVALVPLVVLLLALEVDVVPATMAAFVAGLFLDLYGVRPFGVSTTATLLMLAGGVEALRLSIRSVQEQPFVATVILVLLLSAAHTLLRTGLSDWHAVRMLLGMFALHGAIAAGAYPVARRVGQWYVASLREQGLLSG